MIVQYLTWDDEEKTTCDYTWEIKGTKEQEEYAKWLWRVTKDLSDAVYRERGTVIDNLINFGYSDEEIEDILNAFPDYVSEDPYTAYDECLEKLNKMGLTTTWIEECNNPDVWTSTGIY